MVQVSRQGLPQRSFLECGTPLYAGYRRLRGGLLINSRLELQEGRYVPAREATPSSHQG